MDFSKRTSERGTTFLRTEAGTHQYRAPEVARRWKEELNTDDIQFSYTEKVDLWSVGCIIYEMAAYKRLFRSGPPENWDSEDTKELNRRLDAMKLEKDGIRLVKNLLLFSASERPTAASALRSKWLSCGHKKENGVVKNSATSKSSM
ncbi:kinase-like domain-containing protein [Jackrogersella minutella]|nr:kinase-like domain-containing protein [Jackrogersella minutella]